MTLSRRTVLQGLATLIGARRLHAAPDHAKMAHAQVAPRRRPLHPSALTPFVDPLPIPEVHKPLHGAPRYRVAMREIEQKAHRDLPPTRWWSYGASVPGPTFEVRSGQAFAVEWRNELPAKHFLPVDHTMCGAGARLPEVRTVVHVHGAKLPPESDGYPERWFARGGSRVIHYPNHQDAATLWYHDHAMGIERLNQYAGLFGAYLIREAAEDALGLPDGPYDLPVFLFDRLLDEDGQLQYPTSLTPGAPWVAEMYGDAVLANGVLAPELAVERRAYRLRLVNASNARFFLLALTGGAPLIQIGSDQGLLPRPATLSSLSLAPGERADVVIDFAAHGGEAIQLRNQAAPILQFRVARGGAVPAWRPPKVLREVPRLARASAVKTRTIGLDEYTDDQHGMLMLLGGKRWHEPVTETPVLDTVEIWELVNYTEDTHPIHLHLVRFQVLERQRFDIDAYRYQQRMELVGPPVPPKDGELGWKDTVQAHPESITRIIVRFEGHAGRYVWHCHVLEHAANEMMRPFEVLASAPA